MQMETNHSKVMLDIEVARNRKARNDKLLKETMDKVQEREKEIDSLEEKFEQNVLVILRKQREQDIVTKKLQSFNDSGEVSLKGSLLSEKVLNYWYQEHTKESFGFLLCKPRSWLNSSYICISLLL